MQKLFNFAEYQEEASKTIPVELTSSEIIDNAVYGLIGEVGELVDIIKKIKFQGHPMNDEARRHCLLELGDILWYITEMAYGLSDNMSNVANMNIEKLRARYGDHFDSNKSQNRKEGDI